MNDSIINPQEESGKREMKKEGLPQTPEIQVDHEQESTQESLRPNELPEDKMRALREKIETTDIDDHLKIQSDDDAQNIKVLEEEKKIKKLLELAKSKGVIYAVAVAKKMEDAYVLDALHDALAKDGHYQEFLK